MTIRIVRSFNTYGPRMRPSDWRVALAFIRQAIGGEPITVHGEGAQTRSLYYVDDTVEAFIRCLGCEATGPLNVGNPEEVTVLQVAHKVRN